MGEINTKRIAVGKPRVGMASHEDVNAIGNIYTASGSMEGSEAYLKCSYNNSCSMRNRMSWKRWSVPRAIISLLLVRLGGMSPMTGVLGRATGCSGGIGRAGKLEVSHYK